MTDGKHKGELRLADLIAEQDKEITKAKEIRNQTKPKKEISDIKVSTKKIKKMLI